MFRLYRRWRAMLACIDHWACQSHMSEFSGSFAPYSFSGLAGRHDIEDVIDLTRGVVKNQNPAHSIALCGRTLTPFVIPYHFFSVTVIRKSMVMLLIR